MTPISPLFVPFTTTTSVFNNLFLFGLTSGGGIRLAPPYGSCACRAGLSLPKSFVAADLGVTNCKACARATKHPLFSDSSRLYKKTKRDR